MRGYFGIGIYLPKKKVNIGTLWRSAYILGADFIFTIGGKYRRQASDTVAAYRHVPYYYYEDYKQFFDIMPIGCQLVCVELSDKAIPLTKFKHPERAIYLLGAEDTGIPEAILLENITVKIPDIRNYCLNVSVAGSIVMYDRLMKGLIKQKGGANERD